MRRADRRWLAGGVLGCDGRGLGVDWSVSVGMVEGKQSRGEV